MSAATLSKPAQAQTVSGVVSLEQCVVPAQSVTFSFSSATKSYFFTRTITLNADGSYALPAIPADLYHVKVKGDKWLAAVSDVDTRQGNAALNAALFTGDVNNDNRVDSTDFGLLTGAYNTSASLPGSGYDPGADLNCDGVVDSTDFGLLIGDYGYTGAELPSPHSQPLFRLTNPLYSRFCLLYANALGDTIKQLTGEQTFGYTSHQPETVRFEDDITMDAMQTHLILTTRNGARVRIFNAPSAVQPAILTAPGTVMYDATFAPAPSGPSANPADAALNCVHRLDVTLTPGTPYHVVIDYDATTSFEATPAYAGSYGIFVKGFGGYNGLNLYRICADGWGFDSTSYDWNPYPPIQSAGITSVTGGGAPLWPLAAGSAALPSLTVAPGSVVTLSTPAATDNDTETIYVNGQFNGSMLVSDQVHYIWSATGGSAQGSGQAFTWTAPTQPGNYSVTLDVDDLNHNNSVYGNREDQDLFFPFLFTVAAPNAPSGVNVDISQQAVTPPPACGGQPFLVNLAANASGMTAGGGSCQFTSHSWSWTAASVQYRADPNGAWGDPGKYYLQPTFQQTTTGIFSILTKNTDNPTVVAMTTLFTLPGYYKVTVKAADQYTSVNCGNGSQSNTADVLIQVAACNTPSVYFAAPSLTVGHGPVSGTRTVRAYVTPYSAALSMRFDVTKQNEASVTALPFYTQSGNTAVVDLLVSGNQGTPSSSVTSGGAPLPDCRITVNGGVPSGSPTVLVLIPTSLGTPHPQLGEQRRGTNLRLNTTTTPRVPNVPGDAYYLVTFYGKPLTIQVWDQFKQNLDAIYVGAQVEEDVHDLTHPGWTNINSPIAPGGTYIDYVGFTMINGIAGAASDDALNWPLKDPLPLKGDPETQDVDIRVDGNVLLSGVVNRMLSYTEKIDPMDPTGTKRIYTIIINWP